MGKILLCILIFAGIQLGCTSNQPSETKTTNPSVEGVVNFAQPTMAIGGEVDPSGFFFDKLPMDFRSARFSLLQNLC